jgi:hypothetical protein
MFEIHRALGEFLFLIYVIVIAVVVIMDRRGKQAPPWLIGMTHGLLALQVALGVIVIAGDRSAPWYHPVLGILAMLSIGLAPMFRQRLTGVTATVASLAVPAALVLLAMLSIQA